MQDLSMDLRERVVRALDAGEGRVQSWPGGCGVSDRWIPKLLRQWRETGSIVPKSYWHGPQSKLSGFLPDRLVRLAGQEPDQTLREVRCSLRLRVRLV
jgi:transposase